jgi:hypothetical protein
MISQSALDRYTAGPSAARAAAVKALHEGIRGILGIQYDTFVDIVALRAGLVSTQLTGLAPSTNAMPWSRIFDDLQAGLESSPQYRGKTKQGDKCVKVLTNIKADVVPAVRIGSADADPIAVFSRRASSERKNFPRLHYQNGVAKNDATQGDYKPSVRMFKRWVRAWFTDGSVAPSFYVECLVHSRPNKDFTTDAAGAFILLASGITKEVSKTSVVRTVAGDKDILSATEWHPDSFEAFRSQLDKALGFAARAYKATTAGEADRLWRAAFNE